MDLFRGQMRKGERCPDRAGPSCDWNTEDKHKLIIQAIVH